MWCESIPFFWERKKQQIFLIYSATFSSKLVIHKKWLMMTTIHDGDDDADDDADDDYPNELSG